MAKCDCVLIPGDLAKRKATWEYPSKRAKKLNGMYIARLEKAAAAAQQELLQDDLNVAGV